MWTDVRKWVCSGASIAWKGADAMRRARSTGHFPMRATQHTLVPRGRNLYTRLSLLGALVILLVEGVAC